jgi:hypothetical protein
MRPSHLERFVDGAVAHLRGDARLVGVAAAGSWITGQMDDYSDVDLWIAVAPEHVAEVERERPAIAARLGPLLSAFTGEHVGEPRLLICLYGTTPLAHVDLKFVAVDDLTERVEDPLVLWERDGRVTRALAAAPARWPGADLQWIEDRFWVWIHYGAGKIGRGEWFEALDFLAFLRGRVLGPLLLEAHGRRANGVRRIEVHAPERLPELRATIAGHDGASCAAALAAAARLYQELRDAAATPALVRRAEAERAALAYAAEVEAALARRP